MTDQITQRCASCDIPATDAHCKECDLFFQRACAEDDVARAVEMVERLAEMTGDPGLARAVERLYMHAVAERAVWEGDGPTPGLERLIQSQVGVSTDGYTDTAALDYLTEPLPF